MNKYFTMIIIVTSVFIMTSSGVLTIVYAQNSSTGCPQGQIRVVDENGSPMFYPGTNRPMCKAVDAVGGVFGR